MMKLMNVIRIRIKLTFNSTQIKILSIIMIGLFVVLLSTLFSHITESSKIPVALVDEDHSPISRRVVENIQKNDVLNILENSYEDAMNLLKKGSVEAVYILNQGIEEQISSGDFEGLFDVYYLKGNTVARIIGDIFAAEILYDICITSSVNLLERAIISHEIVGSEEIIANAYEYGLKLKDHEDYQYSIDVEFANTNQIDIEDIDNDVIYMQMMIGIMITFISFFLLFLSISIVKDKETGVSGRIQTSPTNHIIVILGNYISIITIGLMISLVFSGLTSFYSNIGWKNTIVLFMILSLFIFSISALIVFFTSILKKVSTYIMVFTIVILIMGIISGSFWNIDLLSSTVKNLAYLTPNYHAIDTIMNLFIGTRLNLFQYGLFMVFTAVFFIVLGAIIEKVSMKNYTFNG